MSELAQKRWHKFKNERRALISLALLLVIILTSLMAGVIANNKPFLMKYNNRYYYPMFVSYRGSDFPGQSLITPDYRAMIRTFKTDDWVMKPLIFWGVNESSLDVDDYPSPPSAANWFGTDDRGRDILTRLLHGVRVSLLFSFANAFIAITLACLVGGIQGFYSGRIDFFGQRIIEIWNAVPYLFVLILLGSLFQPGLMVITFLSATFSWIPLSYYIRSECLRIRHEEFVLAATALGATRWRNLMTHIIPNAVTPIFTFLPFIMASGVLLLSYLDFLGFGVQAPAPSIGELLHQGQQNFDTAWWLAVFPFAILVAIILLFNFIGEGVRTAFDPRNN